jgi:hypothetical protein
MLNGKPCRGKFRKNKRAMSQRMMLRPQFTFFEFAEERETQLVVHQIYFTLNGAFFPLMTAAFGR